MSGCNSGSGGDAATSSSLATTSSFSTEAAGSVISTASSSVVSSPSGSTGASHSVSDATLYAGSTETATTIRIIPNTAWIAPGTTQEVRVVYADDFGRPVVPVAQERVSVRTSSPQWQTQWLGEGRLAITAPGDERDGVISVALSNLAGSGVTYAPGEPTPGAIGVTTVSAPLATIDVTQVRFPQTDVNPLTLDATGFAETVAPFALDEVMALVEATTVQTGCDVPGCRPRTAKVLKQFPLILDASAVNAMVPGTPLLVRLPDAALVRFERIVDIKDDVALVAVTADVRLDEVVSDKVLLPWEEIVSAGLIPSHVEVSAAPVQAAAPRSLGTECIAWDAQTLLGVIDVSFVMDAFTISLDPVIKLSANEASFALKNVTADVSASTLLSIATDNALLPQDSQVPVSTKRTCKIAYAFATIPFVILGIPVYVELSSGFSVNLSADLFAGQAVEHRLALTHASTDYTIVLAGDGTTDIGGFSDALSLESTLRWTNAGNAEPLTFETAASQLLDAQEAEDRRRASVTADAGVDLLALELGVGPKGLSSYLKGFNQAAQAAGAAVTVVDALVDTSLASTTLRISALAEQERHLDTSLVAFETPKSIEPANRLHGVIEWVPLSDGLATQSLSLLLQTLGMPLGEVVLADIPLAESEPPMPVIHHLALHPHVVVDEDGIPTVEDQRLLDVIVRPDENVPYQSGYAADHYVVVNEDPESREPVDVFRVDLDAEGEGRVEHDFAADCEGLSGWELIDPHWTVLAMARDTLSGITRPVGTGITFSPCVPGFGLVLSSDVNLAVMTMPLGPAFHVEGPDDNRTFVVDHGWFRSDYDAPPVTDTNVSALAGSPDHPPFFVTRTALEAQTTIRMTLNQTGTGAVDPAIEDGYRIRFSVVPKVDETSLPGARIAFVAPDDLPLVQPFYGASATVAGTARLDCSNYVYDTTPDSGGTEYESLQSVDVPVEVQIEHLWEEEVMFTETRTLDTPLLVTCTGARPYESPEGWDHYAYRKVWPPRDLFTTREETFNYSYFNLRSTRTRLWSKDVMHYTQIQDGEEVQTGTGSQIDERAAYSYQISPFETGYAPYQHDEITRPFNACNAVMWEKYEYSGVGIWTSYRGFMLSGVNDEWVSDSGVVVYRVRQPDQPLAESYNSDPHAYGWTGSARYFCLDPEMECVEPGICQLRTLTYEAVYLPTRQMNTAYAPDGWDRFPDTIRYQ